MTEPVEASGIERVILHVSYAGGETVNTTMNYNQDARLWTDMMEDRNVDFQYFVEAFDRAGNRKTSIVQQEHVGYLFSDGFESGSFSAWTGTSYTSGESGIVTNTATYNGTYSASFTSNGGRTTERSYAYKSITAQSEISALGYFYISKSGATSKNQKFQLIALKAGSSIIAYAGWYRTASGLRWFISIRSGTSFLTAYSSSSPITGVWYSVELHWKKGTTNGSGELWVNGAKIASITGKNTAYFGDITQAGFGLPEINKCGSTAVYVDNVVIDKAYIGH